MRLVPLVLLLCLLLAAPAAAHVLGADHSDWRGELAFADIDGTVETVDRAAGTEREGLPLTWCGTERTSDNLVNAVFPPTTQQFNVVYAYAADRASRFAAWKDALQGRRLPDRPLHGRAVRRPPHPALRHGHRLRAAVRRRAGRGPARPARELRERPGRAQGRGTPAGTGHGRAAQRGRARRPDVELARRLLVGDRRELRRRVDQRTAQPGGLFAALWVPDLEPAPGADPDGWWAEGMLHEMTHNLGAVGDSAPHSSGYGHCYDGYDVMCYRDHPAAPAPAMTYPCPRIARVMSQVYDCGGDDYFNVAPAAGSYLATHWNTFDNRFLVACEGARPACGGTTVPDSNPMPPVSTAAPAIAGDARAGSSLTALAGSWANAPLSFEYQWEQGDGTTWLAVPGEAGPTYALTEDDAALRLRVRVIAVNGDGRTAAYSAPTAPVAGTSATAPATPASAAPSRGRAALKIARGRGRGKRIGTIDFRIAGGRLRAAAARVRLDRGRYEVRLCSTAPGTRCARRTLKVARRSAARLPRLEIGVPAGAAGRVTYTLRATRGIFSAMTAKRPGAGLLLGP